MQLQFGQPTVVARAMPPCWDGGQRSKGHLRSMDRAEGSQTYQYMHGINRGRGMQTKVALGQRSGEVCVICGGLN